MSTTARPRWSTGCCSSPAPSARTRRSPSARWIPTTSSASAASPSSPRRRRSSGSDTRINIVDTPGHADFGGEVERILNMVDGALVLVDAAEGPLPQTKFVVSKALKMGLKPIVVINKVDRSDARPIEVVNEVFDLFAALDATDEQLDFPILYGSAKQGWMAAKLEGPQDQGMKPLFELVLRHVEPPHGRGTGPFRLLGTILEANPYLGRIVTGRITSGSVKPNQAVKVLDHDGKLIESGRVTKVLAFRGLERVPVDEAEAGDIVAIAGLPEATVAHTICDPEVETPIPAQPIDPPTLAMTFRVNDSPLAGTEGNKVHRPHDPRPPAARGRRQRRAAHPRIGRQGFDGGRRPRRTAARHPDRDHAARRLRAVGVAAEGAAPPQRRRRPGGADRRGRDRRRRDALRRRRAEDVRAQGRDDRDAALRRRPRAAGVLRADPRPDRLPGRAADRHARHRDHEPPVPRLRAVQGRDHRAAATAC